MQDILPSSIPRNKRIDWNISRTGNEWVYLYCANCGCDGGRVLDNEVSSAFAFYLCNSCAEKHGEVAGTYAVPDDQFSIRRS